MNAITFMKQHGVEAARIVIGSAEMGEIDAPSTNELNRLVESVDIIKELGSLRSAKANLFEMYDDSSCDWVHEKARLYDYKHLTVGRVKQAIADYEAIYSGEES